MFSRGSKKKLGRKGTKSSTKCQTNGQQLKFAQLTLVTTHVSSAFPIYFCSRLNVFNQGVIIVYQLVGNLGKLLDSIAF